MKTDFRRTSVMLPAELHDRLIEQAREAERSLAAEIRLAVREYVRSEPAATTQSALETRRLR
ncbi:MAG: hypothetical protein H0U46_05685 [Actinobacteria bacterium]|nr:hypothetical protein [Actinomycetota bacterium]